MSQKRRKREGKKGERKCDWRKRREREENKQSKKTDFQSILKRARVTQGVLLSH